MTEALGRRRRRGVSVKGTLLRRLMAERGLTGEQLAERAGLSEDVIARARAGRRIEIQNLSRIVAVLLATPAGDPLLVALIADEKDD